MKKGIFAGSFDPIHEGHKNLIKKSLKIFDEILVVVANNPEKNNSHIDKRFEVVNKLFENNDQVKVFKLEKGLISDFAKENNIKFLVRSARDKEDFEFELMMSLQNKKNNHNLETILIMPDEANIEIRSSIMPK